MDERSRRGDRAHLHAVGAAEDGRVVGGLVDVAGHHEPVGVGVGV
jgi:predicted DNA-binding protein with PD1-like motif